MGAAVNSTVGPVRAIRWPLPRNRAPLAGCAAGRNETLLHLRTDNPRVQAAAIAEVVRAKDLSMAGELVNLLESQDEGVRFMAAAGLHKLTGRDPGFHFADAERN